jgi:hypothetical protein
MTTAPSYLAAADAQYIERSNFIVLLVSIMRQLAWIDDYLLHATCWS